MAALKQEVYDYKLIPVAGAYRRAGPVRLLDGVGGKAELELAAHGVRTIGDLIDRQSTLPHKLGKIVNQNQAFLAGCHDPPDVAPKS